MPLSAVVLNDSDSYWNEGTQTAVNFILSQAFNLYLTLLRRTLVLLYLCATFLIQLIL